MPGLFAVYRKELADQLGSRRFLILFLLICLTGVSAVYTASQTIRDQITSSSTTYPFLLLFTLGNGPLPSFITFIGFLGPLVGLALAFDSINGEQNRGTLSRLLSQPIYRDSVINGKFLASLTTVATMIVSIVIIVASLGILRLAVVPTGEELWRLLAFVVVCTLYVGFWLALATTLSVIWRQTATAALAGIAIWIFFTFFVTMIADAIASALISVQQDLDFDKLLQLENTRQMIARLSPSTLFQEATLALLVPKVRTLGPLLPWDAAELIPNPLHLSQSLMLIWPQVVGLLALTSLCFALAYVKFMRQEIRSL